MVGRSLCVSTSGASLSRARARSRSAESGSCAWGGNADPYPFENAPGSPFAKSGLIFTHAKAAKALPYPRKSLRDSTQYPPEPRGSISEVSAAFRRFAAMHTGPRRPRLVSRAAGSTDAQNPRRAQVGGSLAIVFEAELRSAGQTGRLPLRKPFRAVRSRARAVRTSEESESLHFFPQPA